MLQGCYQLLLPPTPPPKSTCWFQELLEVAFLWFLSGRLCLLKSPQAPPGHSLPCSFWRTADPCTASHTSPPCPPQESQGGRGSNLLRKLPRQLLCHSIQRLLPGWKVLCDYAWLPINRNLSAPAAFILASSFSPFGENHSVFRKVFFANMYSIVQIPAQINQ